MRATSSYPAVLSPLNQLVGYSSPVVYSAVVSVAASKSSRSVRIELHRDDLTMFHVLHVFLMLTSSWVHDRDSLEVLGDHPHHYRPWRSHQAPGHNGVPQNITIPSTAPRKQSHRTRLPGQCTVLHMPSGPYSVSASQTWPSTHSVHIMCPLHVSHSRSARQRHCVYSALHL